MSHYSDQTPYYDHEGIRYPRVTIVLASVSKPWIEAWKARIGHAEAARISNEAANLGKLIHSYLEDIHRGKHKDKDWKVPDEIWPMIKNYLIWFNENIVEVIDVEKTVYSKQYGYAGTIDAVLLKRGESLPSIFDAKTSKTPSQTWPLQLSAYKQAGIETLPYETGSRHVIHISKKEPFRVKEYAYPNDERDFKRWLAVLQAWKEGEQGRLENEMVECWENGLGPYAVPEPTDEEIDAVLDSILGGK